MFNYLSESEYDFIYYSQNSRLWKKKWGAVGGGKRKIIGVPKAPQIVLNLLQSHEVIIVIIYLCHPHRDLVINNRPI